MADDPLVHDLTFSNVKGETFTLSPPLYLGSLAELGRIGERIEEAGGRISRGEALSLVREIYRIVDRVGESVADHMSCRAGCAACCRMMVAVTRGEGEILRERIDREPEGRRENPFALIFQGDRPDPAVFLGQIQCGLHDRRRSGSRLSVEPAAFEGFSGGKIGQKKAVAKRKGNQKPCDRSRTDG